MTEAHKRKIGAANKGHIVSIETRKKISLANSIALKGKKQSEETKRKRILALKKVVHNIEWNKKISFALAGRKYSIERRQRISGANSHNWKGGIFSISNQLRKSLGYKLWREAVFARDNYTCRKCKKKGGRLHPHHIKPFSKFPELRLVLTNGLTLCKDCHKKTDTYGGKVHKIKANQIIC